MRNRGKQVRINEDMRVPGTDIILEAGDRISVSGSSKRSRSRFAEASSLDKYRQRLNEAVEMITRDYLETANLKFQDFGYDFATAVLHRIGATLGHYGSKSITDLDEDFDLSAVLSYIQDGFRMASKTRMDVTDWS